MKDDNLLEKINNSWIIKGHKPQMDTKTETEINWLETQILSYSDGKPILSEIEEKATQQKIGKSKLKSYLSFLANHGKIRFIESDFIHTKILDEYRIALLKAVNSKQEGITIAEYKEIVAGTKRFRALIGEIFENEKFIQYIHGDDIETRIVITQKGKEFINGIIS